MHPLYQRVYSILAITTSLAITTTLINYIKVINDLDMDNFSSDLVSNTGFIVLKKELRSEEMDKW